MRYMGHGVRSADSRRRRHSSTLHQPRSTFCSFIVHPSLHHDYTQCSSTYREINGISLDQIATPKVHLSIRQTRIVSPFHPSTREISKSKIGTTQSHRHPLSSQRGARYAQQAPRAKAQASIDTQLRRPFPLVFPSHGSRMRYGPSNPLLSARRKSSTGSSRRFDVTSRMR